eukprot:gene15177-20443_t
MKILFNNSSQHWLRWYQLLLFVNVFAIKNLFDDENIYNHLTKNKNNSHTVQPLFYIYEWPDDLNDVWPPIGGKLDPKTGYSHEFRGNNGAGTILDSDAGLFNTWQFSLYQNMMARLRVSEYRTRDPLKATSFVVPFDISIHSHIDSTGKMRIASPLSWVAIYFLLNASRDKSLWWKNNGHDHFVFVSTTAYQNVGTAARVFFMQICQNCTAITIETSPTKTAIKGRSRKYWYSVPYPSSFHWYEGIKTLPWHVSENIPYNSSTPTIRSILALYIGSSKVYQPASNYLRKILKNQCEQDQSCVWKNTNHSCTGVVNAITSMLLIKKSVFCLAPTGDSLTRKSLFDSLVAGCIPVIFSRASLTQYSWHLSEEDVSKISIYIPMKFITEQDINVMHILSAISPEEILMKQYAIAEIAPRLQYSVVPSHIGDGSDGKIWKSPYRDAADIIIDNILDRNIILPLEGFTNQQLLDLITKQNDIIDNHEDFAALRPAFIDEKYYKNSQKFQLTKGLNGITKLILNPELTKHPSLDGLK